MTASKKPMPRLKTPLTTSGATTRLRAVCLALATACALTACGNLPTTAIREPLRVAATPDSELTCRLPPSDITRYSRQLLVPSFGARGQECLRTLRVLIVGAGGLGCPAALYLAGAGVPRLLRPESEGGAGNAFRDASEVLQAIGMHAPAVPLTDTVVAHLLLSRASIDLSDERPIRLRVTGPDGTPDAGAPAAVAHGQSGPDLAHLLEVDPWGDEVVMTWYPLAEASSSAAASSSGRMP